MIRVKKTIGILALIIAAVFVLGFLPGSARFVYATAAEGKSEGFDVSSYNGKFNWAKAKAAGIEFAIIRIGWGDDLKNQDDDMAAYNMQQCEKYGIPYGVYIYSYALSKKEVDSEVEHTIRMIKGHDPQLGIWFDMEDADSYKQRNDFNPYTHGKQLTNFCLRFLRQMKEKGYTNVGVYANPDYFNNVLDYDAISAEGMIWLAHWYVSAPGYSCVMWQYSSTGKVSGLSGVFDMNLIFKGSPLFSIVTGGVDSATIYTRKAGAPILYGDVNGDGAIDLSDLALLKKQLLGRTVLTGEALSCADANRDGEEDIIDLALVKKHILGEIDLIAEQTSKKAEPQSGEESTPAEQETAGPLTEENLPVQEEELLPAQEEETKASADES